MNFAPSTSLLFSLRESNMPWKDIVGELLDNSLDADATRIDIEWGNRSFRVGDDGRGVGANNFAAFLRLGEHLSTGRRKKILGRYGIGLKEACGRLWGQTEIASVRDGIRAQMAVRWDEWAKSNIWTLPDPMVSQAPPQAKGTEIICTRIDKSTPRSDEFDRLMKELAFVFSPAIRRGIQITYAMRGRRKSAERFETPERTDVLVGDIDVDGKRAHVSIGIVPEGIRNDRSGLHYCYGHRVILAGSNLGCGPFNTSRIFGWVELDDSWRLAKHKNEITDVAREALASAIERFCTPVLIKAGQIADVVALQELDLAATEALRADLDLFARQGARDDKAIRDSSVESKPGSVDPKSTGRRHNDAANRQPGASLLPKGIRNQLRIQHGDLPDEAGLGFFDKEARVIKINTAHPIVRHLISEQRISGFGGTHQIAITLLVQRAAIDETVRGLLPFMRSINDEMNRFSVALGQIMTRWLPKAVAAR